MLLYAVLIVSAWHDDCHMCAGWLTCPEPLLGCPIISFHAACNDLVSDTPNCLKPWQNACVVLHCLSSVLHPQRLFIGKLRTDKSVQLGLPL